MHLAQALEIWVKQLADASSDEATLAIQADLIRLLLQHLNDRAQAYGYLAAGEQFFAQETLEVMLNNIRQQQHKKAPVTLMQSMILGWVNQGLTPSQVLVVMGDLKMKLLDAAMMAGNTDLAAGILYCFNRLDELLELIYNIQDIQHEIQDLRAREVKRLEAAYTHIDEPMPLHYMNALNDHLQWRIEACNALLANDIDQLIPPLSHTQCDFGQWFYSGGQLLVPSMQRRDMESLHVEFHQLSQRFFEAFHVMDVFMLSRLLVQTSQVSSKFIELIISLLDREFCKNFELDSLTRIGTYAILDFCLTATKYRAQRLARPMFFLAVDVDNLQGINDAFGHETGDQVLIDTAGYLLAVGSEHHLIRHEDSFYIFGVIQGGKQLFTQLLDSVKASLETMRIEAGRRKVEIAIRNRGAAFVIDTQVRFDNGTFLKFVESRLVPHAPMQTLCECQHFDVADQGDIDALLANIP